MVFDDLSLKETYDSDEDNILDDFYIPALSSSVKYDRLAGYFSSSTLAASAKGMAQFIRNNGKMRLVTCVQISEQDHAAIINGMTNPEVVITKSILKELDLATQLEQDHVAALAWMVAQGNLEIKIAIPQKDGKFITEELDKNSIYHQKIGILYDEKNNKLSFSGSINETGKAWTGNIEEFKVFCSWRPGQDAYGSSDARKFEKFWYDNARHTKVFDLPTAVKEHLFAISPKTIEDVLTKIRGDAIQTPSLRDYQNSAIDRWFESGKHGIFEMATGTGKTWTSIACVKQLQENGILTVIACPYKHLVTQWKQELSKWGIESETAYGNSNLWQTELGNRILHLNNGVLKDLTIITTHNTFSNQKFIDMIKQCKTKSMVIADEVHKIGAEKNSEGLLDSYNYRLGLSATPERYFDDEGTKKIFKFFGNVVFKFGLEEAIKHGYLTPYKLFPHIVYMTDDETDNYHRYSKSIAIEYSKKLPDYEKIKGLKINRSKIVKSAKNKIEEFKVIINDNKFDHCLVYCIDTRQLQDAVDILHKTGHTFHRFTNEEEPDTREKLLDGFANGEKDMLLAIKCLDEGVDVPSTKTAVILASSHNPIEFIQRRGRILRTYEGKEYAIIHDLIVLPPSLPDDDLPKESEIKIIQEEFARLEEFASASANPEYSQQIIKTFIDKYNL